MRPTTSLRAAAAVVTLAAAGISLAATAAGASTQNVPPPAQHALFLETDASTNSVLSFLRGPNGDVSPAGSYATGGLGASEAGAVADPLASQGGLALINKNSELVAVNPGSNTVSVFQVNGTRLHLIQQVGSLGQFPVSIGVHGDWVSVLNAGSSGSVAEFHLLGVKLYPVAGQVRDLGLTNTNPPDFLHGAGQVGYSPDGSHLVITTKHSTDAYQIFSVSPNGVLGQNATVTPADNAVPFAFNFDAAGHLVGVEASNSSVSTYVINPDGTLSSLGTVSDGATALCWVSTSNGYFYGSNAGSKTISSFSENSAGAPVLVNANAGSTHPGTTDSTVSPDGQFLYVESGGSGALDTFRINSDGSLTPAATILNLPVAAEGIAAS